MESILYNTEAKEVVIILGYGIGSNLTMNFLKETIYEMRKLFPALKVADANNMPFHEVSESSCRHKRCWYTRFSYDLSKHNVDEFDQIILPGADKKVYQVSGTSGTPRGEETAESVMNRLIHD